MVIQSFKKRDLKIELQDFLTKIESGGGITNDVKNIEIYMNRPPKEADLRKLMTLTDYNFLFADFNKIPLNFLSEFIKSTNVFYILNSYTYSIYFPTLSYILQSKGAIIEDQRKSISYCSLNIEAITTINDLFRNLTALLSLTNTDECKIGISIQGLYFNFCYNKEQVISIEIEISSDLNKYFTQLDYLAKFLSILNYPVSISLKYYYYKDVKQHMEILYKLLKGNNLFNSPIHIKYSNNSINKDQNNESLRSREIISALSRDFNVTADIPENERYYFANLNETDFEHYFDIIKRHIPPNASDLDKTIYVTSFVSRYLCFKLNNVGSIGVILDNEVAQCVDYAKLGCYLLNMLGVEAKQVNIYRNEEKMGKGHAVIIVKIDGNEYYLDLTRISCCMSDNTFTGLNNSKFFLVSAKTLANYWTIFKKDILKHSCPHNFDRNLIKESEDKVLGKKSLGHKFRLVRNYFMSGQFKEGLSFLKKTVRVSPSKTSSGEIRWIVKYPNVYRALLGEEYINEDRKNIDPNILTDEADKAEVIARQQRHR